MFGRLFLLEANAEEHRPLEFLGKWFWFQRENWLKINLGKTHQIIQQASFLHIPESRFLPWVPTWWIVICRCEPYFLNLLLVSVLSKQPTETRTPDISIMWSYKQLVTCKEEEEFIRWKTGTWEIPSILPSYAESYQWTRKWKWDYIRYPIWWYLDVFIVSTWWEINVFYT